MNPLRVLAFTRTAPPTRGYVDPEITHVQQLQVLVRGAWETIDEEIVPNYVYIAVACFGDTDGWVSKFTKFGKFGKDGIIEVSG